MTAAVSRHAFQRSAALRVRYEEYHPYGTTAWQAPELSTVSAKRYRYTGKEKDEETGLYYHGARYYAAWLGRWMGADPIGLGDGVNRYAYVRGNPVKSSDPKGTSGETEEEKHEVALGGAFVERAGATRWEGADTKTIGEGDFRARSRGLVDSVLDSGSPIDVGLPPETRQRFSASETSTATQETKVALRESLLKIASTDVGFSLLSELDAALRQSNSTLLVMPTGSSTSTTTWAGEAPGGKFIKVSLSVSPASGGSASFEDITLFHELVHAYRIATDAPDVGLTQTGPTNWIARQQTVEYIDVTGAQQTQFVRPAELLVLGVSAIRGPSGQMVELPSALLPYTENKYRAARGYDVQQRYR